MNMSFKKIFSGSLILISISSSISSAQIKESTRDEYNFVISKGLENILNLQKTTDNGEEFWKGEWGSNMMNLKAVIALGPRNKTAYDSNCFTTALVHNEIAKYALRNDQLDGRMANALNEALANVLTYKSDQDIFNFWHKLPMTEIIKNKASEEYKNNLVARPNNYELKNTFAAVRSNIAEDADDTAVAYSAFFLNNLLQKKYPDQILKPEWSPLEIEKPFNSYRDLDRKQSNPFNTFGGTPKNTGAFLTWLTKENSTFMGSVFKGWKDELRIPEGSNNVDCVVNANVLQMLSQYGYQNSEGAQAACNFIESSIEKGIVKRCGFYYPNPYHLHYAVSQAYEAGASCLSRSATLLFNDLRRTQNEDGSWGYEKTPIRVKKREINDPVSTSIYAANAYFTIGLSSGADLVNYKKYKKAAQYILNSAQIKQDGTYFWNPGIFFSGGTFVRRLVVWKSEAYTSILAIQALDRFKRIEDNLIKSGELSSDVKKY